MVTPGRFLPRVSRWRALALAAGLFLCSAGGIPAQEAPLRSPGSEKQTPPKTPEVSSGDQAAIPRWKPIFEGVDHLRVDAAAPRPMKIHAVRIDLAAQGIRFLATPSNGDLPGETDGLKTSSFLEKHGCQVAVNASPFRPIGAKEGEPRDVLGLSVSSGDMYSAAQVGYGALLINRENKAWISDWPVDRGDAYNAVGGFRLLLTDGKNVARGDAIHPRTAAGISRDGRYLYLVVIDGRQPGYSEGATTAETAEWLSRLGAHSGLNLDGGGSTTLVISDGKGRPRILNRPIHGGVPGAERVNANHLGVFARPLGPSEKPTDDPGPTR